MLNKKFASIRANVKTDKRGFLLQNSERLNNISMNNMASESPSRQIPRERQNLEFVDSPSVTPAHNRHPYVNLMHHNYFNAASSSPYHLQYQNVSQSTPDMNHSWKIQNQPNQIPLVTHFTAAQIYMRPKVNASKYDQQGSPSVSKKPPDVPKRLSSTVSSGSTPTLKKSSELRDFVASAMRLVLTSWYLTFFVLF